MPSFLSNKKGVILYIVLSVIIIVLLLAATLLTMMASQTNFASHQTGRIQAYYAGIAAMNLTLENLRTGAWQYRTALGTNSCPFNAPCQIQDSSFPSSIVLSGGTPTVFVNFCDRNAICNPTQSMCNPPPGIDFCINVIVPYHNF
ncbi:MAG: hypothetical protein PHN57_04345 [Candidatus Omnitrophica bacterium]|nr:hypothetical protein [Candidatus Omnitrophota bacterium]